MRLWTVGLCLVSMPAAVLGGEVRARRAERSPSDLRIWRKPEADGVNSLYLLVKLLHRPIDYVDAEAAVNRLGGHANLLTLKEAAWELGLPLTLQKRAPVDLARSRLPAIVHIEDVRQNRGRFALLYAVPIDSHGKYGLIDSGTAQVREMSVDEFRRNWSGFVLAPYSSEDWNVPLAVSLFVLTSYSWWRSTRQTSQSHSGIGSNERAHLG